MTGIYGQSAFRGRALRAIRLLTATALLPGGLLPAAGASESGLADNVQRAVNVVCEAPSASLEAHAGRLPDARAASEEPLAVRGLEVGWERRFALAGGGELRARLLAPAGRLRRLTVEAWSPDPQGTLRPRLAAVAGADCAITSGRRMVYDTNSAPVGAQLCCANWAPASCGFAQRSCAPTGGGGPVAIQHLDPSLTPTGTREPLDPPVPSGDDPGGVAVALVDSGVNYLLPEIRERLARDGEGRLLGHDYWDQDPRPFDAHPVRSPFFPQRHGTRTASILLREAPGARLVPYRYPRPDMSRMADLVADAAGHGIRVMNIAMGSGERADWQAFAAAARAHPGMLFVISAGNDGRNIDEAPVYPAALPLDNTIVVTSSLPDGSLARGSNWGPEAVDLLVPAERLQALGFDGRRMPVSGSSYAAPRISALAARLLAEAPDLGTAALRAAILERALPPFAGDAARVSAGFMPRPEIAETLPPMADSDGEPSAIAARHTLGETVLYPAGNDAGDPRYAFEPSFAYSRGSGWQPGDLVAPARQLAAILAQCGVHVPRIRVNELTGPPVYRYFHEAIARELTRQVGLPRPTVHFVTDTLQVDGWDAVAYGRSNTRSQPALRNTVWFTRATRDPGIALAHELAHVLMDSGAHTDTPGNLMRPETAPTNTALTAEQCRAITERGAAHGLLRAPATH